MKKLTTIILTLLFIGTVIGQSYEPSVLILSPNEFKYEKTFKKELKKLNEEISNNKVSRSENELIEQLDKNEQLMFESYFSFNKHLDFPRQVSLNTFQRLNIHFHNSLILLSNQKSDGSVTELKKIADSSKMQYVINFPKIELYKNKGIGYIRIGVQLFDNATKEYLVDEEIIGDWFGLGKADYECSSDIFDCNFDIALAPLFMKMYFLIYSNIPKIKESRLINKERFNKLVRHNYPENFDNSFLMEIISETNSHINNHFQLLMDSGKTKFVAFFINQITKDEFKWKESNRMTEVIYIDADEYMNRFNDDYNKHNIHLNSFIYYGVYHNNKWHYQKSNETNFVARNIEEGKYKQYIGLANWNLFFDNSTDFNPMFWSSGFFKKIEKPNKDTSGVKAMITLEEIIKKMEEIDFEPEDINDESFFTSEYFLELTGGISFDSIVIHGFNEKFLKTEEANDEPYIGHYEVVALHLKKEAEINAKQFKSELFESVLLPLSEKIKSEYNFKGFKFSDLDNDTLLIYPTDKSVILTPMIIYDENWKKHIRYFVLIHQNNKYEIYEWRYIDQSTYKFKQLVHDVMDQINTLTNWNSAYNNLNDKEFWDNYVLPKSGNNYKYLTKIQ